MFSDNKMSEFQEWRSETFDTSPEAAWKAAFEVMRRWTKDLISEINKEIGED